MSLQAVQEEKRSVTINVREEGDSDSPVKSPQASYASFHLPPINQKEVDITEDKHLTPNQEVKLLCMTCEEEIKVRELKNHRDFHRALQMFRYTMDNKPSSVKQLVKRRRALMKKLNEPATCENPVSIKKLHKLNMAYELLKSDVEGTKTTLRELDDYYKVEVKGHGTGLSCALAYGVCENTNSRWRTCMEDRYYFNDFFCNDPKSGFFALFDGYNGPTAAETSAKHFHEILADKIEAVYRPELNNNDHVNSKICNAFKETYEAVDKILLHGVDENSRNRWSGCSAATCLLRGNNLYVANAGNVRVVMCKGDGSMVRLSKEHSPWSKKERHRVRKMGEVSKSEKTALVNGLVDCTRGLGNHGDPHLKSTVISQPSVSCIPLEETDQFVILASHGVWEVFSEEEVILLLEDIMPEIDVKAIVRRMQNASAMQKKGKTPQRPPSSNAESRKPSGKSTDTLERTGRNDSRNSSASSTSSENHTTRLPELVNNNSIVKPRLSDGQMRREEKASALAKALSERLVESALLAGSKDNVTVAVILLKGCPLQMFLLPLLS